MELHIDDLVIDGQDLRLQLIDNFKIIKKQLVIIDDLESKIQKLQSAFGISDEDLNNL